MVPPLKTVALMSKENFKMASTVKPDLRFSVDYSVIGTGEKHSNAFASAAAALKFAVEQARAASTHITFKKWENGAWVIDNDNANKLVERLQGKGNPQAVSALTQLQELTGVLVKKAGKQNGLSDNETVGTWLNHVFVSMRAMGVTPSAIDQARAAVYTAPKEPVKTS